MRDNVRLSGSVMLTVEIGLGRTFTVPVKSTDEAEEVVRKIAARDPSMPITIRSEGFDIAYTVKHEECFLLGEEDNDDELPF